MAGGGRSFSGKLGGSRDSGNFLGSYSCHAELLSFKERQGRQKVTKWLTELGTWTTRTMEGVEEWIYGRGGRMDINQSHMQWKMEDGVEMLD